jgi:hypothetical protein
MIRILSFVTLINAAALPMLKQFAFHVEMQHQLSAE